MKPILFLAMMAIATSAGASEWQDSFFDHSSTYREHKHKRDRDHEHYVNNYRPRPTIRHIDRGRYQREPEVRGWVRIEETEHRSHDCRPTLTVVGDQALNTDGAKREAIKAWRQQVRFAHGERYTEPNYARGTTFACVKSSIGSVAGVSEERCEIKAAPCTTPRVEIEK